MKAAIRTSVLAAVAVVALSAGSTRVASASVLGGESQSAASAVSSNHVGGCNPHPRPSEVPVLSFGSIISIVGLYFGF